MSITNETVTQLTRHVFSIAMPTNIGLISIPDRITSSNSVYVIDSGNDSNSGKRIFDYINRAIPRARVKAIINTHSHADHCGGNAFLVEQTSCEVWASAGEAALMSQPSIETALIWGGTPVSDIRSKFLHADSSVATRIFKGEETIALDCADDADEAGKQIFIKVVSLPGHYLDQCGFLIEDTDGKKVFFAGDAISGRNVIKRYWIQYLLDEAKTKESIAKIAKIKADFYVPGHGDTVREIEGLAELNMIALLETEDLILDELRKSKTIDELLKAVADRNGIPMAISHYALIGSTMRSYISSLYESGKITYEIKDNILRWKKVPKKPAN